MTQNKRTVFAPQPAQNISSQLPANHLISVEINEDEDVEWIWTASFEGIEYVSGYNIVKRESD